MTYIILSEADCELFGDVLALFVPCATFEGFLMLLVEYPAGFLDFLAVRLVLFLGGISRAV
jgi:hypothetical protein